MNMNEYLKNTTENFLRDSLTSDEFLDFMKESSLPMDTLMAYYRCAIMEVETKFKVLNEQYSLYHERNPIETIKTRVKSMDSIIKKMRKKDVPFSITGIEKNIFDVAGIRVICSFQNDIYSLAEAFLKQDDITLIERKDYIKEPKPSGYRSLHLIVEVPIFLHDEKRIMKVEVQLRTIAMDFWASLEHKLRYKKNIPDSEAKILAAELSECAVESAKLDEKMENIKNRIVEAEKEAASNKAPRTIGELLLNRNIFK